MMRLSHMICPAARKPFSDKKEFDSLGHSCVFQKLKPIPT